MSARTVAHESAHDACHDARLLVVHVVYRFDVGGLENGVVNLINRMPRDAYRHAVVALTEVTDFRAADRARRRAVRRAATSRPGHGVRLYPALYRAVARAAPGDRAHPQPGRARGAVPAWLAGVPVRIHGEHGRDVGDLDGSSRALPAACAALYRPFVHALRRAVARPRALPASTRSACRRRASAQIYNGVDTERFAPAARSAAADRGCPFAGAGALARRHGGPHAGGQGPGHAGARLRARADAQPALRDGCGW